jgi:ElaB/YqjD/DUF883 family membrane-anchored ribosome-binding protein
MENETDLIRNQMLETRTALTEKLEELEEKVVSTVHGTTETVTEAVQTVTEAVQDTVSNVSESVQETVQTVKSTFDLSQHVQNHPWAMFGGAVVVGYLAGSLTPSMSRISSAVGSAGTALAGTAAASMPSPSTWGSSMGTSLASDGSSAGPGASGQRQSAGGGLLGQLGETLTPLAKELQGMAIGTVVGLVGDMVLQKAPENFRPQLADWIEQLTKALGGTPIEGLASKGPSSSGQEHQTSRAR